MSDVLRQLAMEKPVYGGDCLTHLAGDGRRPGKAVLVPFTLPGEKASVRVVEEKKHFANAELVEVFTASPDRVEPPCPHFGECGGCHYQHAAYPVQIEMKRRILAEMLSRAGVSVRGEFAMLATEPLGYRNRIRLALVRKDGESWRHGYRGRSSHVVVPIETCLIAAPVLIKTANAVVDFLGKNPALPKLSEMEIFCSGDESRVLLTLFCDTDAGEIQDGWVKRMEAALPAVVAGIRVQIKDGTMSAAIVATSGVKAIDYDVAGIGYEVPHGAFFQVNRWLVDDFARLVTADLSGKVAWDLYAGVGLFARLLSEPFAEVAAVESSPASLPAMERNLAGTSARAISSTTVDFLRRNRDLREPRPDAIVLDPPRAGLGSEVTTLLNAIHAPEMVYVSCDPATLVRDLQALTLERYRVERVTLVDMFPQTFHLETVVRLCRT